LLTISILGIIISSTKAKIVSQESDVREPRKIAVLVAIDRYHDEMMRPLKYCKSDALALKKTLIAGGFQESNIILMMDDTIVPSLQPTKENIQNILTVLENLTNEGDMIFFFFSGHGASRDGNSMLLPMDFEFNNGQLTGGLTVQAVLDTLRRCKAGARFVAIDASLSGNNLMPWILPQRTAILLAAKAGHHASESTELQGSVFTQYMIRGLQGEADEIGDTNGKVDLTELFHYVKSYMIKHEEFPSRKLVPGLMVSNDMDDIFGLEIVELPTSTSKTGGFIVVPLSAPENQTDDESEVRVWSK